MYKASANNIRMSPRKVRLVVNQIRGLNVVKALGVLETSSKKASVPVRTLLKSAIANSEQRAEGELEVDNLTIKTAFVDAGATLKRFRPRAMGRASRILKRSSRITLMVG